MCQEPDLCATCIAMRLGLTSEGVLEAQEAVSKGWEFERVEGNLGLFERLVAGDWTEENFLIVPPGWRVTATYGTGILDKEPS